MISDSSSTSAPATTEMIVSITDQVLTRLADVQPDVDATETH
ncbi:hypothetical protein SFUMM280S_05226 [Streptomyces fumanus]